MVAKETHRRYGMFTYTTHAICGCIAYIAQVSVTSTNRMSIAASKLFWRPNWSGVNAALKTRFNAKGSAINHGNFP